MPTASQVYLALDLLSTLPEDLRNSSTFALRKQATEILAAALTTDGWTGATNACNDYGRPPVVTDPQAQKDALTVVAVRTALLDKAAPDADVGRTVRLLMERLEQQG